MQQDVWRFKAELLAEDFKLSPFSNHVEFALLVKGETSIMLMILDTYGGNFALLNKLLFLLCRM